MSVETLSLLNVDEIPEDAACLMIYAPQSDISEEEQEILANYLSQGGKVLVIAGPTNDATLDHLNGLLAAYGVTVHDGVVVEGDRAHYLLQTPLALIPDLSDSAITNSLIEDHYYPILTLAQGLTVEEGASGATTLLTTSDSAYAKAEGLSVTDFTQKEDDLTGPFVLAVSVEDISGGQLVWFSSGTFLEDAYNAYSSGANVNLAMNALASLVGESEAMAIRSKSLDYSYLTISQSTASLLKTVMIGLFPLAYLAIGIVVVVGRKKKKHEAV